MSQYMVSRDCRKTHRVKQQIDQREWLTLIDPFVESTERELHMYLVEVLEGAGSFPARHTAYELNVNGWQGRGRHVAPDIAHSALEGRHTQSMGSKPRHNKTSRQPCH